MIGDGREIDPEKILHYDLCIIGGGAAGITLARDFIGRDRSVVLLESGGLEADPEVQQLYAGVNQGIPYELAGTRLRFFGGTTNHWTGMCRPLSQSDLTARPWVPNSGWPIDASALEPFYPGAQKVCELGPYEYSVPYWRNQGLGLLDLSRDGLVNQVYQLSPPTRFGKEYRDALRRAQNVAVLLHSNAVELVPAENGKTIKRCRIRCLNGNAFTVRAGIFVLASGGIENARLLLASNSVVNTGIGNARDNVGRYFMDHLRIFGAATIQARANRLDPSYYRFTEAGGARAAAVLRLGPEAERRHRIAGMYAGLYQVRKTNAAYSYRTLRRALARRKFPEDFSRHLGNILDAPGEAMEEHERMELEAKGYTELYTTIDLVEQAPDPDSRVRLSTQTDTLGVPRTLMDWKHDELAKKTFRTYHRLLRDALHSRDIARVTLQGENGETGWPKRVTGSAHQMGTTRMHTDPKRGVVDSNCRVFGTSNLFVAGSSVFTHGGTTNPTMTIVALALRLGAHIRDLDV